MHGVGGAMWAGEHFVCVVGDLNSGEFSYGHERRRKPCICGCFHALKRRYELDFGMGLSPGGVVRAFPGSVRGRRFVADDRCPDPSRRRSAILRGEHIALSGITFSALPGQIYGLLGPNGAGKTTALRILSTVLQADRRNCVVGGFDVVTQPEMVRHRLVLFQRTRPFMIG